MNQQYTCLHDKMIEELFIQYDKSVSYTHLTLPTKA